LLGGGASSWGEGMAFAATTPSLLLRRRPGERAAAGLGVGHGAYVWGLTARGRAQVGRGRGAVGAAGGGAGGERRWSH